MSRASLTNLVAENILTGGRRTTATNERSVWSAIIAEAVNKGDDLNALNGYLGISASGLVDISFIKSGAPSGKFLKDDGTWADAGSESTPGLGAVLAVSNVMAFGDIITNTDGSGELNMDSNLLYLSHTTMLEFDSPLYLYSSLTRSRVVYVDSNGYLKSSGVSDTTLGYLDATSSIQTQIDSKLSKGGGTMTGDLILNANATNSLGAVTLQQLQGYVVGLWDDRGNYDASGNVFPSSGGSGTVGAIVKGDIWTISVAGILGGTAVRIGDTVRAKVDSPGSTAGNWAIQEAALGYTPITNVLTSAYILVGNSSNVATGVAMSGDITINNIGVTAIGALKVTNAMIAASTIDLTAKVTGVLPTANGGMDTATYNTLMMGAGLLNGSSVTAGTYYLMFGPSSINTCTSGTANALTPALIYIDSADYPTVNGKTPKLRIRGNILVNALGTTSTITFGLFPVTATPSAGGANSVSHTLGTVVTGSNGAAQASPSANTNYAVVGSDFALPANGWYVIGVTTTVTFGANCAMKLTASLQIHNP